MREQLSPTREALTMLNHRTRMRGLPESPTFVFSPHMRRVESSPPALMGTPSPPLLPSHATLKVRKKRAEREYTVQSVFSSDGIDDSSYLEDREFTVKSPDSAMSKIKSPIKSLEKSLEDTRLSQRISQELPPGLHRRDSSKRKAFAKMIDGAKSKYPRIAQRSFTTVGLLRRSSTRSARVDVSSNDIWMQQRQSNVETGNRHSEFRSPIIKPMEFTFEAGLGGAKPFNVLEEELQADTINTHDSRNDHTDPVWSTEPKLSAVRLHISSELETLKADEQASFWIAVSAEVDVEQRSGFGPFQHWSTSSSQGHISNLELSVRAEPGCIIRTEYHSTTQIPSAPQQTHLMLVEVFIDQYRRPQFQTEETDTSPERAFTELEDLLGESLTPILSIDCAYNHALLPEPSKIHVQEFCFLKRTTCGALWNLPPENDEFQSNSQHDALHSQLICCVVNALDAETAAKELTRIFNNEHPCACSDYLEQTLRNLQGQNAKHEAKVGCFGEKETLSPPASLARYTFDGRIAQLKGLTEAFSKYPGHAMLPVSGLKSHGHTRGYSTEDHTDHAQEIWRHMRNTSKGEDTHRKSADALRDIQNLDRPLWEIRKQALMNKRSVGADTLKSLAASTKGFGEAAQAPWL